MTTRIAFDPRAASLSRTQQTAPINPCYREPGLPEIVGVALAAVLIVLLLF